MTEKQIQQEVREIQEKIPGFELIGTLEGHPVFYHSDARCIASIADIGRSFRNGHRLSSDSDGDFLKSRGYSGYRADNWQEYMSTWPEFRMRHLDYSLLSDIII